MQRCKEFPSWEFFATLWIDSARSRNKEGLHDTTFPALRVSFPDLRGRFGPGAEPMPATSSRKPDLLLRPRRKPRLLPDRGSRGLQRPAGALESRVLPQPAPAADTGDRPGLPGRAPRRGLRGRCFEL